MKITLQQVQTLKPCYSETKLFAQFPQPEMEVTIERLLALPRSDARWLVARLLSKDNRIQWARNCANRAKKYAYAAADAADAAYAAAYAAADAAYAAAYAADAAYAAAYAAADAAAAEHHLAMEDALSLL